MKSTELNGTSKGTISNHFKCKRGSLQSKGKRSGMQIFESHNPIIGYPQETHFRYKGTHRLKVKWQKRLFHKNGKQKKGRLAIKQLDKIDLKANIVARDKSIKCW